MCAPIIWSAQGAADFESICVFLPLAINSAYRCQMTCAPKLSFFGQNIAFADTRLGWSTWEEIMPLFLCGLYQAALKYR
jgi:hypothetical protein